MTIFDLDRQVVTEYARFARSFTTIRAADLGLQLEEAYAGRQFWPEPMIQINPRFKEGGTVGQLVSSGDLAPGLERIFRDTALSDGTVQLHKHQLDAITLASQKQSFVVTTGTGSGKSLCYFLPIIDRILKSKAVGGPARTRAIIIYPMNALANSQLEELDKRITGSGFENTVTFKRYTGQDDEEARKDIEVSPPDIILTNFMMLELLLTRQSEHDQQVIRNCEGLEFLVLDELHTYRGRQGADVAMLVRRVRERLQTPQNAILCVGTSATMASEGDDASRQAQVANVASTLFATPIKSSSVVTETLRRSTSEKLVPARIPKEKLKAAIAGFDPHNATDAALHDNPFMAWIEMTLGLSLDDKGTRLIRAKPQDLNSAADALSESTDLEPTICRSKLEIALETAGRPGSERGEPHDRPFFPIRLHRFIAGAGRVYTTLEPKGSREITFNGQVFLPGRQTDTRLYATYFCRNCGQEHHPVTLVREEDKNTFFARSIDEVATEVDAGGGQHRVVQGFIAPVTNDDIASFRGDIEDYPEDWREVTKKGIQRLKAPYRELEQTKYRVAPDGTISASGQTVWFQPGKFRFCVACGDSHGQSGRDINRLAGLTAEGRSSATTIVINSVLRWMKQPENQKEKQRQKVLGFSDNRQDAALQAGHFNDFVFVSLLRAATLAALHAAGPMGLSDANVGRALAGVLGFTSNNQERLQEWLSDNIEGPQREDAASDLAAVLAHRFWFDQRRGWRFTFPNLEQLSLIEVRYTGLSEFCGHSENFAKELLPLAALPAGKREEAFKVILDAARKGLAIRTDALTRNKLEELHRRRQRLATPWGFDQDEAPREAGTLIVGRTPEARTHLEDLSYVRSGAQSALGKSLRKAVGHKLKGDEQTDFVLAMCLALRRLGLLVEVHLKGATAFRLATEGISFHRAPSPTKDVNPYFSSLYATLADALLKGGKLLFGDEAREHTAQVELNRRQIREKRFRWGEKEQADLAKDRSALKQLGEAERFLPVMFCSPTMELGVDISELDAVYLRNVPPTPANYAQRSGRAGRGGAAALVLTYCSAQSPHDQYFFERRQEMIQGVVRPPAIDLANQDLIDSHLHALWLAESEQPLQSTIAEVLDTGPVGRPLRPQLAARFESTDLHERASKRMQQLLKDLARDLGSDKPEWLDDPAAYALNAAKLSPAAFNSAFDRWRDLLASAEAQRNEARRTLDNFGITDPKLRRAAEGLQSRAQQQISLLLAGSETIGSEFYTYRYLATEGFLPGYNFPRLPLMAFIPGQGSNKRQAYVQRPRFLGISEFGPHSRIYHEGRAYRVVSVQVPASELEQGGGKLLTETVWLCKACGAREFAQPERCHACEAAEGWTPIHDVKRIVNLSTRPAEHITANDEDRQRQGFDIVTTFAWSRRGGTWDVTNCAAKNADGEPVATARYASAATLQRLNLGLRRRTNIGETGFMIDPASGRWLNTDDADEAAAAAEDDPARGKPQRIVPMVEDHKNALLLRPIPLLADPFASVVVQHALLRGLETEFQLEEGELLSEPMPSRADRRAILFYEATEGGAGVLARVARERDALARVAQQALRLMHYTWSGNRPTPDTLTDDSEHKCVKGCYRCLLSYFNQPEHETIDRRNTVALDFLCSLAASTVSATATPRPSLSQPPDKLEPVQLFLARLSVENLPPPKTKTSGSGWQLTWPNRLIAVLFGSTSADRRTLENADYQVFEVSTEESRWPAALGAIKAALGE